MRWRLDGVEIAAGSHAPLGAGQVSTDNVTLFWTPSSPGTHRLRFEADTGDFVIEHNETNNAFEARISVAAALPDLLVDDISFSSTPRLGELTVATVQVTTAGGVARSDTLQVTVANVSLYSDVASGRFYQVAYDRSQRSAGFRVLEGLQGALSGRTSSRYIPLGEVWHRFRIRIQTLSGRTRIRARFWPEGTDEPSAWSIDAEDRKAPLTAGPIGLLSRDERTEFDDLGSRSPSRSETGA